MTEWGKYSSKSWAPVPLRFLLVSREPGDSKWHLYILGQVPTAALLTMIIGKNAGASLALCSPVLTSLLTARRRNQKKIMGLYGERALGGPYGSGTPRIVLAQRWGVTNNQRLLAFSQKESSFSKGNFLARSLRLKYWLFFFFFTTALVKTKFETSCERK